MRRMLQSTRPTPTADAAFKKAIGPYLMAGLILALGWPAKAQAQSFLQQPSYFSPVQTAMATSELAQDVPIVDASYFGDKQSTDVKPASYWGDLGYQTLYAAECQPGAYSCVRCDFTWYYSAEMLFFRREGSRRFSLTQNVFMDETDYEFGGRFTVGRMLDCVDALEFVYSGPFEWNRDSFVQDPGNVNSLFLAFPEDLLLTFNGADEHTQRWRARANSFEMNYRHWVWDSVSTMVGVRYFKYEEDFSLTSFRPLPDPLPTRGEYISEINNDLVGAQLGGDIFFPLSLRTSMSLRAKGGVYANFATRELQVLEDGATVIFNANDSLKASGIFEFAGQFNFQITPSIRLNAGYEAWWLSAIATTEKQRNNRLTFSSGTQLNIRDDILLHGFAGGLQVLY